MRTQFDHERWDVYNQAVELVVLAYQLEPKSKGAGPLLNQLRRAASSVVLNIAEGAGEFGATEKRRFYRMARRSATESVAALHLCQRIGLISQEKYEAGRTMVLRIVAMTVGLCKVGEPEISGLGSGSGSGSDRQLTVFRGETASRTPSDLSLSS